MPFLDWLAWTGLVSSQLLSFSWVIQAWNCPVTEARFQLLPFFAIYPILRVY